MKKTIGMMALLIALSTMVFAQQEKPEKLDRKPRMEKRQADRPTPEMRARRHAANLKQELNLTDEQAEKLTRLMKEQSEKQKALAEQMRTNRLESREQLKSILTQEQYIKLLEKQTQRGQHRRHQMRRRGGVERG